MGYDFKYFDFSTIMAILLTENEKYKHAGITRLIIGCAMSVHNQLGNGFQELIYHRALAMDMKKKN